MRVVIHTTPQSRRCRRHPSTACTRPASVKTVRPRYAAGAPYDPVLTRRCIHGGRKPAKPLVANVLTDPALSGMT